MCDKLKVAFILKVLEGMVLKSYIKCEHDLEQVRSKESITISFLQTENVPLNAIFVEI